ncbi:MULTISPECIES: extracellular solute-binding protein [Streptomyces]|jgi:arabinogalactan oligomer/maltooligosaccharide transport system substrate-binding protein|uniref:extracellular solute-binding protein n=1 Tax=unclassified Streptomyces TaxID=2593676 RepID=UPI0004C67C9E|nr:MULTISPECIES: extracellular solute-binding protein [unclassified Streptomyces]MDX2727745.1 extracellular solute-binding protein [Streptomyces sp. PA03-2a]MDX3764208.1 extracellular solute-binding protein [Streptomyces sp. AK08-01B]MDX3814109.1 extracellular solute-binding protein [Streptomyces sp. AK08-01A]WSQ29895.1 extracellular solute-binding protein [Streptomyces sp. NBC_01230]SCY88957.1 carbohydrate ABC transporter substrate-binding protein, CUT1 family [Streptomyces sp. 136MFCol5.1]
MRRGITATALVAALALAATACGSDDKSDGSSKSSGELSGTVTWWDTSTVGSEDKVFKKIAEDFEKQHPKVDVKYVNVPFGEAQNKFKNAAQSGSGAPDVIRSEVAWTPEFADLGYLAPLDGTPALQKADDFLKQAAASTKYNGKTYAVPQVIDSMGIFYNKKIFKEAGVEVPTTVDQLKTVSKKIKEKTGKTGLYLRGDDAYWFLSFLYGEGGDLVDASSKSVTVDNPEGVKAMKVVKDLVDSGAAKTDATDGWENMQSSFKDGKVAMIINGPWAVADTYAGKEFKDKANLGVAPVPAGSAAQGAPQGGHNLAVYAGSKNLDASYAFVDYMTSTKTQAQVTKELNLLPTRTSAYSEEAVVDNEIVGFFKPVVETAVERPWIPETGSLFAPLVTEYTKVLTGQTTPEKAAKATGDSYRKLLKGWK